MRGEAPYRKSIPKAPFFCYLFVYDHIIMVEKLNQVVLPKQFGNFIFEQLSGNSTLTMVAKATQTCM
jgi:hypothetical protein